MSSRDAYINHALNGGEVSTRFEARQDQNKYQASVRKAENWVPLVLGGVRRREGTIFVAETKYSGQEEAVVSDGEPVFSGAEALVVNEGENRETVLIPFKFNIEQAYIMEFGDLYVRFFKDGAPVLSGGTPLELVTPYPESMLRHIKMSAYQSADVMYIPSDGTLPVYKLRRTDNNPDTFDIAPVIFRAPATVEAELTGEELGGMTLTPGATTGDGVTFTASNGVFLAGDVGLAILGPNGARAVIETFNSSTSVDADIIDPFLDTNPIAPEDWALKGTPSANANPSKVKKGGTVKVTFDADVARQAWVGLYLLIYGGLIEIRRVSDARKIHGIVLSDLIDRDLANPTPTAFWSLEENAWTDEDGYPTAGCFYQERNWLMRGQTRWGSNSGDFENFAKGSDDSAGIARTIADDEVNDGVWIKGSANGLFTATGGGMYRAMASSETGPLTPNDFNEAPVSGLGTAEIAPVRIEGILLYVQDGNRKLIEQAFNFVDNKFDSPDLLLLADHLTEFNTLLAVTYQQRPDSLIWAVRNDGKMMTCSYLRKEGVVGWAQQVTDGVVKDVAVIPRPETSSDWVWIIVEREAGGVTKTYIEYFEHFDGTICREWRSVQTDSAVFRAPVTVPALLAAGSDDIVSGIDYLFSGDDEILGLDDLFHLEGKTVRIIGDGWLFNDAVVTNGQVPVLPQITGVENMSFEVGLDYVSDGQTLEPIIPQERGGPLMARGWVDAGARIRRTMGLKLNGEPIPFRQATDDVNEQVPLKRGKVVVSVQKCDGEGRVSFVQDVPFPAEILNIFGRVSVMDEPFPFLIPEEQPPFLADCIEAAVAEFGDFSIQCDLACPLGQFAEVTYSGGTDPAGPAIRVRTSSSSLEFTGLVALYIPDQQGIALVLYDGESLADVGTVITTVFHPLQINDVLRIEADLADETIYRVKVNGVGLLASVLTDTQISIANPCVGFVQVGEITSQIIVPPTPGDDEDAMIANQSADQSKTNDTLEASDLSLTMEANSTYVGHFTIEASSASAAPDIKFAVVAPALAEGRIVDNAFNFEGYDIGEEFSYSISAGATITLHINFTVVNGANAGNLTLQFAQFVTNATATVLKKHSHMIMFKKA